jgi:hypothetical protein
VDTVLIDEEKARRGELIVVAPVGYRKAEDQGLEKDPDSGAASRVVGQVSGTR